MTCAEGRLELKKTRVNAQPREILQHTDQSFIELNLGTVRKVTSVALVFRIVEVLLSDLALLDFRR